MREAIIKVAAEKIQIHGLRKFTMDELASELKVSKKTIYKYFKGKDDIISEYFKEIIETDKNYTIESVKEKSSLVDKLNAIIYSYHKYKLSANVLDEAYKFYYDEWEKVQELKNFKLGIIESVLKKGMEEGILKKDINLNITSLILESVGNTLLNYKFLSENNINIKDAMDDVIKTVLYGILK